MGYENKWECGITRKQKDKLLPHEIIFYSFNKDGLL